MVLNLCFIRESLVQTHSANYSNYNLFLAIVWKSKLYLWIELPLPGKRNFVHFVLKVDCCLCPKVSLKLFCSQLHRSHFQHVSQSDEFLVSFVDDLLTHTKQGKLQEQFVQKDFNLHNASFYKLFTCNV